MNWGACDPDNPKNRRLRCSALFERIGSGIQAGGQTAVLVDTSPDFREQILRSRLTALDGVLYTHDHADHTHGIDDLRMVSFAMKKRIDVHFDAATGKSLIERFAYCFKTPEGSNYRPILNAHIMDGVTPIVDPRPRRHDHGDADPADPRRYHIVWVSRLGPRLLPGYQCDPRGVAATA